MLNVKIIIKIRFRFAFVVEKMNNGSEMRHQGPYQRMSSTKLANEQEEEEGN